MARRAAGACYIKLSAGGESFVVGMEETLLGGFLGLANIQTSYSREDVILLILEHVFSDVLHAVERNAGVSIMIDEISRELPTACTPYGNLNAEIRYQGTVFPVAFFFTQSSVHILLAQLDRYFSPRRRNHELLVPVAFGIGTTLLALKEIKTITIDDVILFDRSPGVGLVLAKVGGYFCANASYDEAGRITLSGPFTKRTDDFGASTNMPNSCIANGVEADATFDDIEVELAFELGRTSLRLEQVAVLGAGHVFDLGKDPRTAVDIYAGGRRIGFGEIVQINETLGVRVTRLFNNE